MASFPSARTSYSESVYFSTFSLPNNPVFQFYRSCASLSVGSGERSLFLVRNSYDLRNSRFSTGNILTSDYAIECLQFLSLIGFARPSMCEIGTRFISISSNGYCMIGELLNLTEDFSNSLCLRRPLLWHAAKANDISIYAAESTHL